MSHHILVGKLYFVLAGVKHWQGTRYSFFWSRSTLWRFSGGGSEKSLILNVWAFKISTVKNKRQIFKVEKTCYFRLRLQNTIHYIPIWSSCGALSNYTCGSWTGKKLPKWQLAFNLNRFHIKRLLSFVRSTESNVKTNFFILIHVFL